jgi:ribosome-interacting GTPase 1
MPLVCSITQETISNPVIVLQSGHTYEGSEGNIAYLQNQKKCACCNQKYSEQLKVVSDIRLSQVLNIVNAIAALQGNSSDLDAVDYSRATQQQQDDLARCFTCPTTKAIMLEPVILSDGDTVEQDCAEDYIEFKKLMPEYAINHTLKTLINTFLTACPDYLPQVHLLLSERNRIL